MIAAERAGSARRGAAEAFLIARLRSRWPQAIALVLILLVIVATAVLSYRAIDRELTAAALSRRTSVSDLAAATLSEKFDRLADIGVSLATRVRFRQLVAAEKWVEAGALLRDVPRDLPFIERLFLTDMKGTLTADVPELPNVRGRNFAERDWYQGVSRDWKPYVSRLYQRAAVPQFKVFAVAVPIRSETGAVSGILVLQMRPEIFFQWAKAVDIGPSGIVYVVDPSGQVAFHSAAPIQQEKFLDFSSAPTVQRVLRGDRGVEVAYDPLEKQDSVSAYTPVSRYGWGVIVQQPSHAAFATRNSQLNWVLIAYGLISLFLLFVVYLSSRIAVQRRQAQEGRRIQSDLEHRVAERTAQLGAAVDTANDAIISADEQGRIVYFNRGAERLFGQSAEQACGQPLTSLMPERFRGAHRAGFQRFLATGEPRVIGKPVELIAINSEGKEFPVELSLADWATDKGVFFTAVLRDITERRRAEQALRESEQDVRMLHAATLAISRAPDTQTALVALLKAVCDYTGWAYGQAWLPNAEGTRLELSNAWYSADASFAAFHAATGKYAFSRGEGSVGRIWASGEPLWLWDLTPDPTRVRRQLNLDAGFKSLLGFPVLGESGVIAVIEFYESERRERDEHVLQLIATLTAQLGPVIERKQAAEQINALNMELSQHAARLEAANKELEGFSYSVSHDLRAPLRALVGFSSLMAQDHADQLDVEARRKLSVIQDEAQRMGMLIDDLLSFSRIGRRAMQITEIDMTELARATLEELNGNTVGPKAAFHLGALPRAKGDRVLLGQVWANLLANALKFSSKREHPMIEVSAVSDDREHVYVVRDNGTGFDSRYSSKLFGVFQRLHDASEFPGTGVGLALVERIVTRHGGRVWAESKPNEGATFYFSLPKETADG